MRIVDAHVHLSDKEYKDKTDLLIEDAKNSNALALVSNAMDYETSIGVLNLREEHPGLVYAALGIHPWNVNILKENELEQTMNLISEAHKQNKVVAIGEIGLDCKYESIWDEQLFVFDKMLRLAERLNLPVIIHSRGTASYIVDILPSYNLNRVLLHWFSHPMSALQKAMERDYYITEGPPVVYSAGIREVVSNTPLTNLLTETDGPVLFRKSPFNGELTRPSFIQEVIRAISEIKQIPIEQVSEQIIKNFETFFNLKLP
jgi:TatD DNase family protein